jgi:hypothetical protein
MPKPKSKPVRRVAGTSRGYMCDGAPGPRLIGGELPPLSRPQRELVRLFIEHLRSLPIWEGAGADRESSHEGCSAYSDCGGKYGLVALLLCHMVLRRDGPGYGGLWKTLEGCDDSEQCRFWNLLENAGPTDPVSLRRARAREIADHKHCALIGVLLQQKYLRKMYGVDFSADEIIRGLATVKLDD